MRVAVIAVMLLAVYLSVAGAAEVSGRATIVDGDTLRIGDVTIRLHGIDAPEARQSCDRAGVSWLCGSEAAAKLRELVNEQEVVCFETDRDRYGRVVAVCTAGHVELGAAMVLNGLALAYREYGQEYVLHESAAKNAQRGLWAGYFVAPWDWRSGARVVPVPSAGDDCRIKGNINSRGDRIYHLPGSTSYGGTVIDESRGERWFCTEEEARQSSWRAPR